ncbi:aspartate carbamoyltransferase [Patescibacteria group bacterium]|nr:aspartate carbamoyltransferase [Patescibacteria group bacterium]
MGKNIDGKFKGKDILSLNQFSVQDLQQLFRLTKKIKSSHAYPSSLRGKLIALLFYEPSSRTFGSFNAAVKRLGGNTIDILDPKTFSSVSKGETLEDTIKVFQTYSDAIVIRHPEIGAAQQAADAADIPVINAGDGVGEHPTQALLDLFTIYENCNKLDNLTGVIAGDILNGRTVHSLIRGLTKFKKNTLYLLSPKSLKLTRQEYQEFSQNLKLIEIENEQEMPQNADFWYWTRVQKERFKNQKDYEKVKNQFVVSKKLMNEYAGNKTILMHPLPRVGEILKEVDNDPRSLYLKTQVKNGMFVRMALLSLILGKN